MHARNRRTGSPIVGTLERLDARCNLVAGGFSRGNDGRITHEHEGGTDFFYDTSEQVRVGDELMYLDEDGEQVAESDIELCSEDGTPEAAPPPRPKRADDDPDATARGIAERVIATMVGEVDDYHEALATAREPGREDGEEEAEKTVSEAHEAFVRNASDGIEDIEIASGFMSLSTARDTRAPIIEHADRAVIRLEGPNAVQIHCSRTGERFSVDEVSAREYGHVCCLKPDKAHAAQLDVYADAILHTWGPWDR